uniref:Movement protein n=1 Tax=Hydrangea mosaic virus TaxID=42812 RepID=Q9IMN5_9BROM|nr:putative movement protein 3a [Hydrangea mosaic virus]
MALVKSKPLLLTAANEDQLYKQISGALESVNKNLKMFRACVPLELKNNGYTSFELCDEDTRSLVTAFSVKVRKNINVDHPHIFLLWIPRILKSTSATAIIKCKYLATGDEKAVGKFPLNEAFIFSFGWERSIRMKDAYNGKGLHLFIQCFAPNSEARAPLGRLVPMWDNCATAKMRFSEDVGSSLTTADEMRVRNVLTDKDTRSLLRSYMATEFACREFEEKFTGAPRVQLSDDLPETLDFTCPEGLLPGKDPDAADPKRKSTVVSGNGVVAIAMDSQSHNTP